MALALELVTVPRPSAVPRAVSASVLYGRAFFSRNSISCRKFPLPESRGLRIKTPKFVLAVSAGKGRSCRGVVCEAQDTATVVPAVTEASWKSLVLEGDLPVLVEFWAPWCGPCRVIDPLITELSVQYAGKLKCFKLNTDESPKIATQYGIRSIPTVMIFRNGDKKDAVIGAVPKSTLIANIEKFLERFAGCPLADSYLQGAGFRRPEVSGHWK